MDGAKLFSRAAGQRRPSHQTEGHICPQALGAAMQGFFAQRHTEGPVQQAEHTGGVGAAARHARPHGDIFLDVDVQPRILHAGKLKKQLRRLYGQIAPVGGQIGQAAPEGDAALTVDRNGHQIAQVYRLKDRLQLVVAVCPEALHAEIQIELCKRLSADAFH